MNPNAPGAGDQGRAMWTALANPTEWRTWGPSAPGPRNPHARLSSSTCMSWSTLDLSPSLLTPLGTDDDLARRPGHQCMLVLSSMAR